MAESKTVNDISTGTQYAGVRLRSLKLPPSNSTSPFSPLNPLTIRPPVLAMAMMPTATYTHPKPAGADDSRE